MTLKSLIVLLGIAALLVFAAAPYAAAQTDSSPLAQSGESTSPLHYARHRITINPGRLLYRRCVDWYELQNRPSGTVLFPQMHCWWVRG
jgi:hypothetical protein